MYRICMENWMDISIFNGVIIEIEIDFHQLWGKADTLLASFPNIGG